MPPILFPEKHTTQTTSLLSFENAPTVCLVQVLDEHWFLGYRAHGNATFVLWFQRLDQCGPHKKWNPSWKSGNLVTWTLSLQSQLQWIFEVCPHRFLQFFSDKKVNIIISLAHLIWLLSHNFFLSNSQYIRINFKKIWKNTKNLIDNLLKISPLMFNSNHFKIHNLNFKVKLLKRAYLLTILIFMNNLL